ncbi:AMP-binding enzyme, partial [Streptomyces violascens]|uniref:AMP-binding enzyme n=1 Tax=Streptomyces violascens TaxID=67381 RepID=UPI0036782798
WGAGGGWGRECLNPTSPAPWAGRGACTVAVVDRDTARASTPIGVPVHRTDVAVLDERGEQVPDGRLGELHVTGVQLARGYLGRPDLTAERFVHLPDGRRAYRTGDLVLRLPDGQLEYAGRIDDQVKIRGHRVEPAEVEAALTELPGVIQAAVVARRRDEDAAWSLCAFVVLAKDVPGLREDTARARLERVLPSYLVPSAIRAVPALPETASGKTDRKALPNPFIQEPSRTPSAARVPDTMAATKAIWSRVLCRDVADFDATSDFHALGGDSLAVLEMLAALGQGVLGQVQEQRFVCELGSLSDNLTLGRVVETVDKLRSTS